MPDAALRIFSIRTNVVTCPKPNLLALVSKRAMQARPQPLSSMFQSIRISLGSRGRSLHSEVPDHDKENSESWLETRKLKPTHGSQAPLAEPPRVVGLHSRSFLIRDHCRKTSLSSSLAHGNRPSAPRRRDSFCLKEKVPLRAYDIRPESHLRIKPAILSTPDKQDDQRHNYKLGVFIPSAMFRDLREAKPVEKVVELLEKCETASIQVFVIFNQASQINELPPKLAASLNRTCSLLAVGPTPYQSRQTLMDLSGLHPPGNLIFLQSPYDSTQRLYYPAKHVDMQDLGCAFVKIAALEMINQIYLQDQDAPSESPTLEKARVVIEFQTPYQHRKPAQQVYPLPQILSLAIARMRRLEAVKKCPPNTSNKVSTSTKPLQPQELKYKLAEHIQTLTAQGQNQPIPSQDSARRQWRKKVGPGQENSGRSAQQLATELARNNAHIARQIQEYCAAVQAACGALLADSPQCQDILYHVIE